MASCLIQTFRFGSNLSCATRIDLMQNAQDRFLTHTLRFDCVKPCQKRNAFQVSFHNRCCFVFIMPRLHPSMQEERELEQRLKIIRERRKRGKNMVLWMFWSNVYVFGSSTVVERCFPIVEGQMRKFCVP